MAKNEDIHKSLNELIKVYNSIPEGHFPPEIMDQMGETIGKLKENIEETYVIEDVYDES